MKKIYAFLFLFSIASLSQGQSLVLTQANNEPAVGDQDESYDLDTSGFTGAMPVATTGSNVTWDFTHVTINPPSFITSYLDPQNFNASSYPGCTVVETDGYLQTFIKSATTPTTQTEILGIESSTLSLVFSNSAVVAKYPISYGTTVTDNLAGAFNAFSYTGTCTGNIVTKADGSGTLMLPNNITLSNVLRVKSVQSLTLSVAGFPVATGKQTVYDYYHSSKKFAVLSVNYESLAMIGSSSTVTAFATGNKDLFSAPVGIMDHEAEAGFSAYPNPFGNELGLDINTAMQPTTIRIFDQLEKVVLQQPFTKAISTGQLSPGIYFLELETAQGMLRKKIIRQ